MRSAKASAARTHTHRNRGTRSTRTTGGYRVTGTWPAPGPDSSYETPDRRLARKLARKWAEAGAYVVVQEHREFGVYRTVQEIDGPALAAEREAADRAERDAEAARIKAALAERAEQRRAATEAARDRAQAAALMVQPPVPRQPGQRSARHTAGQR